MSIEGSGGKQRYTELARLLRARREELGLSRREITAATGLSYPYVSQLESGYRAPSVGTARKLADALYLPVEDLVHASSTGVAPSTGERRQTQPGGFIRNPRYAGSTASSTPSMASAVPPSEPRSEPARSSPPWAAGVESGAGQDAPGAEGAVGQIAAEVAELLRRLPPGTRLQALTRAQALVMEEIIAEEVGKRGGSQPRRGVR